jgi:hypothetical protein
VCGNFVSEAWESLGIMMESRSGQIVQKTAVWRLHIFKGERPEPGKEMRSAGRDHRLLGF